MLWVAIPLPRGNGTFEALPLRGRSSAGSLPTAIVAILVRHERCLLASVTIRLASTTNPSPPTRARLYHMFEPREFS
jgi:hypothetical protein